MGRRSLVDRFKRTLTQVGGKSISVTLPIEYLEKLGWEKGTEVEVSYYGRTKLLVLEKVPDKTEETSD